MPEFDPNECEERQSMQVAEGDYQFEVVDARNDESNKGNEMIVMELAVEVGRDDPMKIPYVYLVFTAKALYQVKGFCGTTGLSDEWKNGSLDAEVCVGVSGKCHLILGEPNQNTGKRYMEVQYYVEPEGFSEQPATTNDEASKVHEETVKKGVDKTDDIPF